MTNDRFLTLSLLFHICDCNEILRSAIYVAYMQTEMDKNILTYKYVEHKLKHLRISLFRLGWMLLKPENSKQNDGLKIKSLMIYR